MEFYYIIYYALFISLMGEMLPLKEKKLIMFIWCMIFTLIGGLRWQVGGDWDQYYDHFLFSKWTNIFNYDRYGNGLETLEPGFVFFNVLIKSLFGTFWAYNLIVSAFYQLSCYKFCNTFFPKRPLMVYVFMFLVGFGIFHVRAGLSFAICLWAWNFIRKQNLKGFLLVVFAASMIHNQCIVLLPCYWLGKIKLPSIALLSIYPLIAISSYVLQDFFMSITMMFGGDIMEKAYAYTQGETEGFKGASYMGWALNYLFLIAYLWVRKVYNFKDDLWYNSLLNCVMIYNAVFMVFSNGMGDLARLSNMFFPSQVILFSTSLIYFLGRKNVIVKMAALVFFLAYLIYKIPSNWSGYFFQEVCVPYKTIFDYNLI